MERPKPVGNEIKSILNLIDNGKELSEILIYPLMTKKSLYWKK